MWAVTAESTAWFIALFLPVPPPLAALLPNSTAVDVAVDVAADEICFELKRGELGVSEAWPISKAVECTVPLCEAFR
ncbi:MAG: hypothetical protein EOO38_02525 [Cytophagaceae bacterium]|nr:MAG: hypothetical protein EOO38_02525 [Cytophagaceae bacterium]